MTDTTIKPSEAQFSNVEFTYKHHELTLLNVWSWASIENDKRNFVIK